MIKIKDQSGLIVKAVSLMESTFKSSEEIDKDADNLQKNHNKRKIKKNLREKRRSTGVILMPGNDIEVFLFYMYFNV